MAEELAKKNRIRGGHRAKVTKRLKELTDLMAAGESHKLHHLRLSFTEKLETLKRLDEEIVELLDDNEVVMTEIDQANQVKDSIYKALVKIELELSGTTHVVTPLVGSRVPPTMATPPTSIIRAKLPMLALGKFHNDLMSWMTFWDSFESTVHSNSEVDELRSSLEKSAKEAIAGLALMQQIIQKL